MIASFFLASTGNLFVGKLIFYLQENIMLLLLLSEMFFRSCPPQEHQ